MWFIILLCVLAIGGRWTCYRICPLGIIQEIIFKNPFLKKYTKLPYEEYLTKIKYIIFILLVILIPTLFMPNKENWKDAFLFIKLFGFTTVFILALFIYRPFCKYFCPFGVFLGFFNKISPFRYKVEENCNSCTLCKNKCKMNVEPYKNPNSMECIRCGECIKKCPRKAIHS